MSIELLFIKQIILEKRAGRLFSTSPCQLALVNVITLALVSNLLNSAALDHGLQIATHGHDGHIAVNLGHRFFDFSASMLTGIQHHPRNQSFLTAGLLLLLHRVRAGLAARLGGSGLGGALSVPGNILFLGGLEIKGRNLLSALHVDLTDLHGVEATLVIGDDKEIGLGATDHSGIGVVGKQQFKNLFHSV